MDKSVTTASLFTLIRDRLEIMQVVSKDGKPRTEALEALAEIEKRMDVLVDNTSYTEEDYYA